MAKNILVLGGGGREHAIVKALKLSKDIKSLGCAPGNPGISREASCYISDPNDMRSVLDLVNRIKPDLVIIGPEAPLSLGVADSLRRHGFKVFGPNQRPAQLEASKVFAKNFISRHAVPTARFSVCVNREEVVHARALFPDGCVIKADGLAAGKGVRVCRTEEEFQAALVDFFEKGILGKAVERVLVEEIIDGYEMSLLALVADGKFELLPVARDYKRLLDGNLGPNTGGMGAFAPVKVNSKLMSSIISKVVQPTLNGMLSEKLDYRGVLYFGLMIKNDEPYLLEYNVRFGDPEVQVIMPLLKGDWADVFMQVADGVVPKLKWKNESAVCIVIAASGYPENPVKGARIVMEKEITELENSNLYFLHAGTASHHGYITAGGRVMNIVSVGKKIAQARTKAYKLVEGVVLQGKQFRTDIALGERSVTKKKSPAKGKKPKKPSKPAPRKKKKK